MRRTRRELIAALIATVLPVAIAAAQSVNGVSDPPRLALTPCAPEGVSLSVGARCGTLTVFENRATRQGRTIGLRVVVLPATGKRRALDPVFYLEGGPGASVVAGVGDIAREDTLLRVHRDLVLVDQRGTGGSYPLMCNFYGPPDSLQSYFGDFTPPADVRRCREKLSKIADLTQYTTTIAVADLDDVRAALGAEQVNLTGGSYATRFAQEYMRRYPTRVRSAALFGLVPPSEAIPQHFGLDAQHSLDAVIAECRGDSTCRAAFPRLGEDVRAVFDRLARGPVPATIQHPRTSQPVTVRLSRDMVAETLRYMLYQSGATSLVPAAMHKAATGDFDWLASRAFRARSAPNGAGIFEGIYLAITCAEDVPFTDPAREADDARNTFLGDYRMRQQRAACEIWGRSPVPADFRTPVKSNAAVLLVTGSYDPVTPPRYAAEVARSLTNVVNVVVPFGGHGLAGLAGLDCVDRLMRETIERGSVAGLDVSCIARIRRPGFPTELPQRN
jgi:pimeloyl-ACP methyl ester carboxylesterase